jgi:hypothetical protein
VTICELFDRQGVIEAVAVDIGARETSMEWTIYQNIAKSIFAPNAFFDSGLLKFYIYTIFIL